MIHIRRAGAARVFVCAFVLSACAIESGSSGDFVDTEGEVATKSEEIIGGTSLADVVATSRSLGLVDVRRNGGSCSGALIHPDWVLTATHCLDTTNGFFNTFRIPRDPAAGLSSSGASYDERFGDSISVLENTDMSLVHLWTAPADATWPNVTRSAAGTLPADLVGKNISCYGKGVTGYATPPNGVVAAGGTYKLLTKTVASTRTNSALQGTELVINATAAGNNIIAWGDSGSSCIYNNRVVSVTTSAIDVACYDDSTSDRCKETTTRIGGAGLRSVSDFSNYINEAPNRPLPWALAFTNLESDWTQVRRLEYSSPDSNLVILRGQVRRTVLGSSKLFQLPASLKPAKRIFVPVSAISSQLVSARLRVDTDGSVYVQFADSTPADVTVYLDGVSFSVKSSSFEALPFENSWTSYSTTTFAPAVRKVDRTVYLQGILKHPSTPSSMIAARLPASYRPSTDVYVPVVLCNTKRGRVKIQPTGYITIQQEETSADPGCLTSLDGVSFRTSTAGTTAVAMENNWTGGAYSTNQLSFVFDGPAVRFLGAVQSGTNAHVITLPAKFRPRSTQVLTADGCNAEKVWLAIATDGKVLAFTASAGLPSCFVSFDGVSFVP